MNDHEHYMRLALEEAERGATEGNVAVGSILVAPERVVARGRNLVTSTSDPTAHAEIWEQGLRKLQARSMPPVGSPRPDEVVYAQEIRALELAIDRGADATPRPGRTATFHRLSRTEYQHAVRDLLDLEVDVGGWLPGDDAAYGFDNNGDVLSM